MYERLMAKAKKAMWAEKDPKEDNEVYTQVYVVLLDNAEESQCVEREVVQKLSLRVSAQLLNKSNAHHVEEVEDESSLRRQDKENYMKGQGYDLVPDSNLLPGQVHDSLASEALYGEKDETNRASRSDGIMEKDATATSPTENYCLLPRNLPLSRSTRGSVLAQA